MRTIWGRMVGVGNGRCRHRRSHSGPDVLTGNQRIRRPTLSLDLANSGTAAVVIFVDDAGVLSSTLPGAAVVHVAAIIIVPGE